MEPNEPPLPMETPAPAEPTPPPLVVTPGMVDRLRRTRPWMIFLAVLALIGAGLTLLLGGFMVLVGMFAAGDLDPDLGGVGFVVMGFFYFVGAAINVMVGLFLLRCGTTIGTFLQRGEAGSLERALDAQRQFWKMLGILAIVYIVMIIFVVGVAMVVGFLGAMAAA